MQVPAAMNIESAADALQKDWGKAEWIKADQLKELQSAIGAETAETLGVLFPLSDEAKVMYALGLQTARTVIAGASILAQFKIDPASIL